MSLTYAERRAMRPGAPPVIDQFMSQAPGELVVDHPDSETPSLRQAGTLGESQGPESFVSLVKESAESSLYYFNLVFMNGHTLMAPHVQGEYCNFLQAQSGATRKLLLAPRGTLKTTITKGLCLHTIIQPLGKNIYFPHGKIGYLNHNEGTSTRILLASQGAKLSQSKLIEMRTHIETSTLLRAFWPQCFWHDPGRQATAWNNERLFFPRRDIFKEATIETTGVDAKITGSHYNMGIYDDLIGEEDRFSTTVMNRVDNWISAVPALFDDRERGSLEVFLGTHWSNNDIYVRLKRDDPRLDHRTYSAIKEDGTALWPEVYPLTVLNQIEGDLIRKGQGDLYALNYLNDPHHSSIVVFTAGMIRYFRSEGDSIIIEDDPRDIALNHDFSSKPQIINFPRGTKFTPSFYETNHSALTEGLRGVWLNHRYPQEKN